MDRDKIISRVKKLLSFTAANATEAEVENAMTLARRLIEEYDLEDEDLRPDAHHDPTVYEYELKTPCHNSRHLIDVLATMCDCQAFYHRERRCMVLVGLDRDCTVVRELYHILLPAIRALASIRVGPGWGVQHTSYFVGVNARLRERVNELKQAAAGRTTAIVLRKDTLVKAYLDSKYVLTSSSGPKRGLMDEYTRRGYADGGSLPLDREATGSVGQATQLTQGEGR